MKTVPSPMELPSDQDASGRTLGDEEIALLSEVIRTGTLISTKGKFVGQFEEMMAKTMGVRFAVACSSGTAAIHIAMSAINLEPGDEVITSPITDMGAITPIIYQGAIPVFADVDPKTLNLTAATIADRLSDRTKAIVATHLFGSPCEVEPIARIADERGLILIEDCAQAFLARSNGRLVGSVGRMGCFSLQQGKHITTGEGGIVVTDDESLARRLFLAVNKAWGYGDPKPDHYFLALNYRLSELQGAVAVAQMEKLESAVQQRIMMADRLTGAVAGTTGLSTPSVSKGDIHVYWKYGIRVDSNVIDGGADAVAVYLKSHGISSTPRYIQKPAYRCAVISDQRTFGTSRWPFTLARPEAIDYRDELFPGVVEGLARVLVLPWTERYEPKHIDFISDVIRSAASQLSRAAG